MPNIVTPNEEKIPILFIDHLHQENIARSFMLEPKEHCSGGEEREKATSSWRSFSSSHFARGLDNRTQRRWSTIARQISFQSTDERSTNSSSSSSPTRESSPAQDHLTVSQWRTQGVGHRCPGPPLGVLPYMVFFNTFSRSMIHFWLANE